PLQEWMQITGPRDRLNGTDLDRHRAGFAFTQHGDLYRVANAARANFVAQARRRVDGATIDTDDDITSQQSGFIGTGTGLHFGNDYAALVAIDIQRSRKIRHQILNHHAELAALDLTVFQNLIDTVPDHTRRDRKTDTDIAAAGRDDRRVDADQLAAQIDQRTAGVAGVDGGIGLNEILIPLNTEAGATQRTDDAGSHGLPKPERIANRDHKISNLGRIAVRQS